MNYLAAYSKLRARITILFGLLFFGVGLGFLFLSVAPTLYDWLRMQQWEPVSAELIDTKLERARGDKSTTYNARARYRYHFAGQTYEQDRVAVNTGKDNVGEFQEKLARDLNVTQQSGAELVVWVNPKRPQEAVIDRSLRITLLLFKMVFVLVFGGIGLMVLIVGFRTKKDSVRTVDNASKPWLAHRAWANNNIRSEAKSTLWFASIFAIIWNIISFPLAFFILPSALATKEHPALIVLLFPAVGLGLAYWAIKSIADWRRFGDPVVVLDPFPGAIGGHFGARLELPIDCANSNLFKVTLACLLVETNVGSENKTRETMHWQIDGLVSATSTQKTSELSFYFNVPKDLPVSEIKRYGRYYRWRLMIASQQLKPAFSRTYIVPVYATEEPAYSVYQDAETHPLLQERREQQIDKVSDIDQIPGGVRLYLPYGRAAGNKLLALLVGLCFTGFGVMAWIKDASLLLSLIFGGLGSGVFLYALYALSNSVQVQLDQQGLTYQCRILGFLVTNIDVPRGQIKKITHKESYSTSSGNKHETVYRVQAELVNGKTYTLVDSLKGRATAEQMQESISLLTGYPYR